LDALCKRYDIKNEHRTLHGALLDSEILADVYLAMTGGQKGLLFGEDGVNDSVAVITHAFQRLIGDREPLAIINASAEELTSHQKYLEGIEGDAKSLWH
jgi:DNA polymerase-3 subunit epsilon